MTVRVGPSGKGVEDGAWLLVDLLLHVGRPVSLRRAVSEEVDVELLGLDGISVAVEDGDRGWGHGNDLVLVDFEGGGREVREGQRVGAEVVCALAHTNYQRRGAPRSHDGVGGARTGGEQRVAAD